MKKEPKQPDVKSKKMIQYLIVIVLFIISITVFFLVKMLNRSSIDNNVNVFDENSIIDNIEETENENILKVILDNNEIEDVTNNQQENKIEDENNTKSNNNKKDEVHTTNSKANYYIKVNNSANTVTIYKKDDNGNYTIPIKAMICSIGNYTPPCSKYPNAKYVTNGDKYKWATLEGHVYGQYATRIVGGILFHSIPYTDGWKNSAKGTLEYWEYDKLGTKASLGCVRLCVQDAKWIYDNIGKGTTVEFYSDDNPGPLGKPTIKKISDYPDYLRGWDPTDPDKNNPWKTYVEPVNAEPTNVVEDIIPTPTKQPEPSNENTNTIKNKNATDNNTIKVNNNTINNTILNNTVEGNTTFSNKVSNYTTENNNKVQENVITNNSIVNN